MLILLKGFLTVMLTVIIYWLYFYFLTQLFVLRWPSFYWPLLSSLCCNPFYLLYYIILIILQTFPQLQIGILPLSAPLLIIFVLIWMVFMIIKDARDFPWEDIFNLGASAKASEFHMWVQVGIDVLTPRRKYNNVKPNSFSRFSATFFAAIDHRNYFFHLYQHNKSFLPNAVSSNRLVIIGKGFLNLPNFLTA